MRLIDADAVFPWYVDNFKDIKPSDVRFSMNDIKGNLDNIPTIETSRWIPVSEGFSYQPINDSASGKTPKPPKVKSAEKSDDENDALDKITEEIQTLRDCSCWNSDGIIDDVEDIIDKYRPESEVEK